MFVLVIEWVSVRGGYRVSVCDGHTVSVYGGHRVGKCM